MPKEQSLIVDVPSKDELVNLNPAQLATFLAELGRRIRPECRPDAVGQAHFIRALDNAVQLLDRASRGDKLESQEIGQAAKAVEDILTAVDTTGSFSVRALQHGLWAVFHDSKNDRAKAVESAHEAAIEAATVVAKAVRGAFGSAVATP